MPIAIGPVRMVAVSKLDWSSADSWKPVTTISITPIPEPAEYAMLALALGLGLALGLAPIGQSPLFGADRAHPRTFGRSQ